MCVSMSVCLCMDLLGEEWGAFLFFCMSRLSHAHNSTGSISTSTLYFSQCYWDVFVGMFFLSVTHVMNHYSILYTLNTSYTSFCLILEVASKDILKSFIQIDRCVGHTHISVYMCMHKYNTYVHMLLWQAHINIYTSLGLTTSVLAIITSVANHIISLH